MSGKKLYVVSGSAYNARANVLATRMGEFDQSVLVWPERDVPDHPKLKTKMLPNPLAVLRKIGMSGLKERLDRYLLFPSREVLFTWAFQRSLVRQIKQDMLTGTLVTVVITAPPHALSLLGRYLKKRVPQIRLVIDWQDLWSYDTFYLERTPRLYHNRLYRLEREAMEVADVNVVTNYKAGEILVGHLGVPQNKVVSINHHFFEDDDVAGPPEQALELSAKALNVAFLGTMFKAEKVPGLAVLQALDEAAGQGVPITLHLIGDTSGEAQTHASTLNHCTIKEYPRVPHVEALRQIKTCDVLLLVLAELSNSNVIMHAKLPHYFQVQKPIVAMVPDQSFVAEVIEQTQTGVVLGDEDCWAEGLADIAASVVQDNKSFMSESRQVADFGWSHLRKEWLRVLGIS